MKPDFSGEYVLNRQESALSPSAQKVTGATIRIDHREPVVHCWGGSYSDDGSGYDYEYQLRTDDPELAAETGGARMFWDGDILVSEFSTGEPNPLTVTWKHELLDGGRRLRAVEEIRGAGGDCDNIWEFERR